MRWLSLTLLVAVAGCGSDYATAFDGCTAINQANSKKLVECSGAPSFGDQLTLRINVLCTRMSTLVGQNKVAYNRERVQTCVDATSSRSCSAILDSAGPAECALVFTGSVATGGSCEDGSMCASQECDGATCTCNSAGDIGDDCPCKHSLACVNNACTNRVGVNQPCTNTDECQPGMDCLSNTCQQLKTSGSCVTSDECAPFYTCKGADPSSSAQGTCTKFTAENQACSSDSDCVTAYCEGNRCKAYPSVGGACGMTVGSHAYVGCSNSWCSATHGGAGTCQAYVKANAACDSAITNQCTPGTGCRGGVCTALACY